MRFLCIIAIFANLLSPQASAYTANKVWFEFMDTGQYKVVVNYTVPELKEFRESYVIFNQKRDAEAYFWALVRGADFYPGQPLVTEYKEPKLRPDPW
ncbi:hypothetical protein [Pseudobacteriovorax antillogorgiicola]|uniref:KTSC domain-containing protein n=1 Tax=Pseudobacteriovorax antillogorgiicola TaxID=1513793 RepID=A0A1Y6BPZ9_9BACT|nr:hypothetical protein [Pseudobacteriovorax antillogorgiicola]TCS53776.1 hypothetical protein EDD56_10785 [Pseudobacteriovorax antillogorgiicola]SMF22397.1 hypothetical protein SAMN06296036_107187 [Pseudobacteriovorax antillogorgiicola]